MRVTTRALLLLFLLPLIGCGGGDDGGVSCPTTTSPPPDVSGEWVLTTFDLASSTCPQEVNDAIEAEIGDHLPCAVDVQQSGNSITAVDCDNEPLNACVDEFGVITGSQSETQTVNGCTVTVDVDTVADSSESPSTLTENVTAKVQGNCTFTGTCEIVANFGWVRADGALVADGGSAGAAALARTLTRGVTTGR